MLLPMVVHLDERVLRWSDVNLSSAGYGHAIHRYGEALGHLAEDIELAFGVERRPTFPQVAAVHAAGRAGVAALPGRDRARDTGRRRRDPRRRTAGHGRHRAARARRRDVLFVAADRLPDQAGAAGPGSVLVTATSGDPAATGDPVDLLDDL